MGTKLRSLSLLNVLSSTFPVASVTTRSLHRPLRRFITNIHAISGLIVFSFTEYPVVDKTEQKLYSDGLI
jgi:hypothetical protein